MTRRSLLLVALLAGCGFELRRPTTLALRTVALTGFKPRSPLHDELKRALDATGTTQVVEARTSAQAVLEAIEDSRERSVVATTTAGQVRELQLRARFEFRVATPTGRELIAPTRIALQRDLSWSETLALGKEQEEAQLFRAMQSDIVSQVLRRLAVVSV